MEHLEADVCVVGAGFAGLTAARRLTQEGLSAVVLEARERVGGRAHTEMLPGGATIDHGGAWLGPGQDAAYGLAAELGVATYPTYTAGKSVFVKNGVAKRYSGSGPALTGPAAARQRRYRDEAPRPHGAAGAARGAVGRAARRTRGTRPRSPPGSTATWHRGSASGVLRNVLKDLYTADPAEVSLLYALYLIATHHGLDRLFSMEGGDQQDRVAGGMQGIAERVAAELGEDAVRLGAPVDSIAAARRWRRGDRRRRDRDGAQGDRRGAGAADRPDPLRPAAPGRPRPPHAPHADRRGHEGRRDLRRRVVARRRPERDVARSGLARVADP